MKKLLIGSVLSLGLLALARRDRHSTDQNHTSIGVNQ